MSGSVSDDDRASILWHSLAALSILLNDVDVSIVEIKWRWICVTCDGRQAESKLTIPVNKERVLVISL